MSYARFYAIARRIEGFDDAMKEQLVWQYTHRRTTSLHEMSDREYNSMCTALEHRDGLQEELRAVRSKVLHQMQLIGVDTADWSAVNAYCMDSRIAGKPFGWLKIWELEELLKKLRAIRAKMQRGGEPCKR